jgi:hypothetical protein
MYSSAPVSTGNTLRDLQRLCETTDNAECYISGMSNRGSPEGHMGHICVVVRATHDMPDIEYVFLVQNVFTLGNSLSYFQV